MTDYIPENMQQAFIRATIVNSSSDLFPAETGSATDIALLKFVHRCKKYISASRQACEITRNIPFSSTRKRMSTSLIFRCHDQRRGPSSPLHQGSFRDHPRILFRFLRFRRYYHSNGHRHEILNRISYCQNGKQRPQNDHHRQKEPQW